MVESSALWMHIRGNIQKQHKMIPTRSEPLQYMIIQDHISNKANIK